MSESSAKWSLTILAAYSQRWSPHMAQEFQDGVGSLLTDVEGQMRTDYPSLHLKPLYLAAGRQDASQAMLGVSFAFAIFDVTDYDEELALLVGRMQGALIPYILVYRHESGTMAQRRGLSDARVIPYQATMDLFRTNSLLYRHISQEISQARVLAQLVYDLWFPRDTSTIWVVCPQVHDPGEYADRSNPDYTYLDNLGDTDALLEIMVFLSRYYPRASIEKFSSVDLPRDHTRNNLVVIGGPGCADDISNHVCQEMMTAIHSRVSYTADCERMLIALGAVEPLELRAELRSDAPDPAQPNHFNMRRDYGYFARFPNPLNEDATVVLINGIHTAGVLGAARAFADRREALRNYHAVFTSGAGPISFECYFEVRVLHGDVRVPSISPDSVYSLGQPEPALASALGDGRQGQLDAEKHDLVTVLFIVGDRGGSQRNQIQTPREFNSIDEALRACKYRDTFYLAPQIPAATRQKFVEAYRYRPAILHFAGHGDDRSLTFILDEGPLVSQTPVTAEQLAAILGSFPDRIRLCVLNTCNSASVAKYLVDTHVVDAAVGWPAKLADAAAIAFSRALYGCLGDGLPFSRSIALAAQSYGSEETPELYTDEGVDPDVTNFVTRTEE